MKSRIQFNLRFLVAAMSTLAVLLGLLDWIPPFAVVLIAAWVALTLGWFSRFLRQRLSIPMAVATLHTLLITLLSLVPDGPEWNDTRIGMALAYSAYVWDTPVVVGLKHFGVVGIEESLRTFQAYTASAGTMFWFLLVGLIWPVPLGIFRLAEDVEVERRLSRYRQTSD